MLDHSHTSHYTHAESHIPHLCFIMFPLFLSLYIYSGAPPHFHLRILHHPLYAFSLFILPRHTHTHIKITKKSSFLYPYCTTPSLFPPPLIRITIIMYHHAFISRVELFRPLFFLYNRREHQYY